MKSSYFIPYSLLSWCVGLRQIFWLDFYYTGICLLLCWQYYRLARACDLSERASMMFVLLQVLLFGNNIFSFYRYYGISSSIYAQLGAVALTRIALEAAKHPQLSLRSFFSLPCFISRLIVHRQPPALRSSAPSEVGPTVYRLLLSVLCLLPLIRYNHAQGLGIAGLGVGAVIVWRLIEWRRSALWWLVAATLVINVLFLWLYPRPAFVEIHRAQGFLNAWYGFNILNLTSSAGDRMLQIVSVFGLVNLAAALFLIRRNHVIAWLTILPVAAMLLPCIAVPLEQILTQNSIPDNVITFQRFFVSIPSGLSLTCCLSLWVSHLPALPNGAFFRSLGALTVIALTVGLLLLSPAYPYYNRSWHLLYSTPRDLRLIAIVSAVDSSAEKTIDGKPLKTVAAHSVANIINTIEPHRFPFTDRFIAKPITESISGAINLALSGRYTPVIEGPSLTPDAFATAPSAWTTLNSTAPEFVKGITDFRLCTTALQNPLGQPLFPFTSELIPISPELKYRAELSIKQLTGTSGIAYLGVIWYDEAGRMLLSNIPTPTGAGHPYGWDNGTYSYFGLSNDIVPATWTTYIKSFGSNESAEIPLHARYLRIGALLNHNSAPGTVIQLTNVRLWRKLKTETIVDGSFSGRNDLLIVAPSYQVVWSYASQAGQLSRHWPAQTLAADLGGSVELTAAAKSADYTRIVPDGIVFERTDATKSATSHPK